MDDKKKVSKPEQGRSDQPGMKRKRKKNKRPDAGEIPGEEASKIETRKRKNDESGEIPADESAMGEEGEKEKKKAKKEERHPGDAIESAKKNNDAVKEPGDDSSKPEKKSKKKAAAAAEVAVAEVKERSAAVAAGGAEGEEKRKKKKKKKNLVGDDEAADTSVKTKALDDKAEMIDDDEPAMREEGDKKKKKAKDERQLESAKKNNEEPGDDSSKPEKKRKKKKAAAAAEVAVVAAEVKERSVDAEGEEKRKKKKKKKKLAGDDEVAETSVKTKALDDKADLEAGEKLKSFANPPHELKSLIAAADDSGDYSELFTRVMHPREAAAALENKDQIVKYMRKGPWVLDQIYKRHREIVQCFEGMSCTQALDRLCDPSLWTQLELPSLHSSRHGPERSFKFVGRRKFSKYPSLIRKETFFSGYSGRGKSHLMAAMACYIHTYEREHEPVVYIQTSKLVGNFNYLVEALLQAYVRHPDKQLEILACGGLEERVLEFCEKERPLVFMDEVNQLNTEKKQASSSPEDRRVAAKWREKFYHRGPSCSSTNSTFLPHSKEHSLRLKEGFDVDELAGWLSSKGLSSEDPRELIHHTGLIPRLLEWYTDGKEVYINNSLDRLREFLEWINTSERELLARRILNGEIHSIGKLDTRIFFERQFGDGTVVSILPSLEDLLRAELNQRRVDASYARDLKRFEDRRDDFQNSMRGDSLRGLQPAPALNGLLSESISLECILLHRRCFDWQFKQVMVFREANGKVLNLADFSDDQLEAGVCFIPRSSQAEDADAHVVQLIARTLFIHSLQLTVSAWKLKRRQNSHVKWANKVEHMWSLNGCTIEPDFTYVLPSASSTYVSDGKISKPWPVYKRKFKEMHGALSFIDELKDPELEMKTCMGTNKDGSSCGRVKCIEGDYYRLLDFKGQLKSRFECQTFRVP